MCQTMYYIQPIVGNPCIFFMISLRWTQDIMKGVIVTVAPVHASIQSNSTYGNIFKHSIYKNIWYEQTHSQIHRYLRQNQIPPLYTPVIWNPFRAECEYMLILVKSVCSEHDLGWGSLGYWVLGYSKDSMNKAYGCSYNQIL